MPVTSRSVFHSLALAALAMTALCAPLAAAQNACADSVQGRISWAGPKAPAWTAANVAALCRGAETSTAPGECFSRVMSGSVNFGGGTIWNPSNALRLCAGTTDAQARIVCFDGKVKEGTAWAAAIDQCAVTAVAAVDPGSLSPRSGTFPKPEVPKPKFLPTTPPARAPGSCSPTGDCDGDGVSLAAGDCDDADASRYPGAAEVADLSGHDEDCNDLTLGEQGDTDGDGFIDHRVCNGTICGPDCDDARPAVNPHAAELPNRRDDNCNGIVDDDLENWWNPAN